ncbi:MAG: hypothetical protein ACKO37_08245 [Vampirovibrionales bacterium]
MRLNVLPLPRELMLAPLNETSLYRDHTRLKDVIGTSIEHFPPKAESSTKPLANPQAMTQQVIQRNHPLVSQALSVGAGMMGAGATTAQLLHPTTTEVFSTLARASDTAQLTNASQHVKALGQELTQEGVHHVGVESQDSQGTSSAPPVQTQHNAHPVSSSTHAMQETSHKTTPLQLHNPRTWNLSTLIPPLGVGSAVLWGLGNLAEHDLHAGHTPKLLGIHKLFPKSVADTTALWMAKNAPMLNMVYGVTNTIGAYAQGYALRGSAFGAFTTFTALLTPMMMKNNALATKVYLAGKAGTPVAKDVLEQGVKLHNWSSLFNAVAPVGLLTGLFSITKVGQSRPDVKLEHPKGNSLSDMMEGQPEGHRLTNVLARNAKREWQAFADTLGHTPKYAKQSFGAWQKAFHGLAHPDPDHPERNALNRFLHPITNGMFVPLMYSHATAGRVLYSTLAAAGFFTVLAHAKQFIREPNLYEEGLKKLGHALPEKTPQVLKYNKGMATMLFWGNFAGAFAGLLTKFNDWPLPLSLVYRTSGIAYGAAAVESFFKLVNVKNFGPLLKDGRVGPYDGRTWTKVGAFIQGTSYFVNLLLKNMNKKPQASSSTPSASSHPELAPPVKPVAPHASVSVPTSTPVPLTEKPSTPTPQEVPVSQHSA